MSALRARLAKLLQAELRVLLEDDSVEVDPMRLYPATGWYRTSPYADCYRWEGSFTRMTGLMCSLDSWDTMTDCCRYGVKFVMERPTGFEVSAKRT